ncbi:MAG: AEC family transporter [Enhygromyxa sp.]
MLAAATPLLLATLAGVLFGALRLFREPDAAIATLNRLCLYLAFPALIFANVYEAELALALAPGFLAASLLPTLALLGALALLTRRVEPDARAALGIGSILGNIAYLGIPLSAALLGPQVIGLASVNAALHIVLSIPLGTWVLLRWGRPDSVESRGPWAEVVRQPLVWAPILAMLARLLPAGIVEPVILPFQWIGAAASPVALFMIGLYLHAHRRSLAALRAADAGLIAAKLLALPGLALACVLVGLRLELLELEAGKVVIVQAAMPTAITTFALAEEYGVGREPLVRGIVGGTIVFMLSFWLLGPLLGVL